MPRVHLTSLPRILVTLCVLLAMLPGSSAVAAQTDADSYTDPTHNYTVAWTNQWTLDDVFDDESTIFLLRDEQFEVGVFGFDGNDVSPYDAVVPYPDEIVVEDRSDNDPPRVTFEEDGMHIVVEAYSINEGATTVLVSVVAPPDLIDDAVAFTQQEITVNGQAVMLGQPIDGSAESTTTVGSDGLATFTGPVYGYSISYDPAIWTVANEINEGNVDGIQLNGDGSAFSIWAWDNYGSDPLTCLEGEINYYSTQMESVTDWQPMVDSNGEPLRYESDNLAWGMFDLTYTNDRGESYALVDYISCEPIPGQDASLIVLISADPAQFDTELEKAFDVLDTLTFGDMVDSGNTETDSPAGGEITISLDGTEYTSPNYGFTAMIPLEWQILEETVEGTNEVLVLGNGTSVVTLWATQDYGGDLAGCVDFAADTSGLALTIDTDASGGEFRGVYRGEAYANFVYQDNGTDMVYFINCQMIPGTNAYLILIHDVPYSDFTAERRFRSEIENSIVMP